MSALIYDLVRPASVNSTSQYRVDLKCTSIASCGNSLSSRAAARAILLWVYFFFFQAEDGIRDYKVTGVQTCALPICHGVDDAFDTAHMLFVHLRGLQVLSELRGELVDHGRDPAHLAHLADLLLEVKIGRASCRERV